MLLRFFFFLAVAAAGAATDGRGAALVDGVSLALDTRSASMGMAAGKS
jgi:hypothetical protein